MEIITSKSNPKIKEFSKLKQKKYIEETGQVLLEGQRMVEEAYRRGIKFIAVLATNSAQNKFDCPFYQVAEHAFEALSAVVNSQGIVAVVSMENPSFSLPKGKFLLLDNISDPGNLGTIIRTAVACNFVEIYCLNCVDFRNEKVLRSTMGTIFGCKVMQITPQEAKRLGKFNLICADMHGEPALSMPKPTAPFGLVVGNEANGVSEEVKKLCTVSVTLPMDNGVESLNAAVACGILMYNFR